MPCYVSAINCNGNHRGVKHCSASRVAKLTISTGRRVAGMLSVLCLGQDFWGTQVSLYLNFRGTFTKSGGHTKSFKFLPAKLNSYVVVGEYSILLQPEGPRR